MAHVLTGSRQWLAGGAVAATLLLSGCADGVEFNGKIFDYMGISPAAQEARKFEPKLAARAPLVVPPDVSRLPEPGSEAVPEPAQVAWPDDSEQRKVREAQERERLHLAYCRGDVQWKQRALNNDNSLARSPFGPCPSVFGNVNVNKD